MTWRTLLSTETRLTAPWVGGRELRKGMRTWKLEGRNPPQFGWHEFELHNRTAKWKAQSVRPTAPFVATYRGFLVGNRFIQDDVQVDPDPKTIFSNSEEIFLVEEVDRFTRISAGRTYEGGPLIFYEQEMPLGSETEVLNAFLDRLPSVDHVKNVPPALDAAFRLECLQRDEADRRRAEIERRRREDEERRIREERRRELVQQLGDGAGRRAMAAVDFTEAAKAALAVGNATYLDHRKVARSEMAVRFRFQNRRFECVVDERTLGIIDAEICLTDHDTGEKGDTWLSLEALPSVINEAIESNLLHVYRHA